MKINYSQLQLGDNLEPKLVKLHELEQPDGVKFTDPKTIVDFMNKEFEMDKLAQEELYVLFLTACMRPLMVMNHSKGSATSTTIDPASILRAALLCGAQQIIVVHNHPSGDVSPSRMDITMTRKLKEICELLGVYLTDHIIVGNNSYVSFKESKLLDGI